MFFIRSISERMEGPRRPSQKSVISDSRIWPAWARSVAALAEAEAVVRFMCPACRKLYAVDLEAMILLRGRQWSLIDRRGKCKWVQCRRRGPFVAAPNHDAHYILLSTTERLPGWLMGKRPRDDEPKPPSPPMPPAPKGVDPVRWAYADERERKMMVRMARG